MSVPVSVLLSALLSASTTIHVAMSMSVSALLRASPSIGGIGRGMLVPDTKAHSAAREVPCTSPTDLRSRRTGLFLF